MNETITFDVLQAAIDTGVREFIICAGSRNTSFVQILSLQSNLKTYYHPEERSAAFFALGRSRNTGAPVAIITTSGTAVGELLPAAMEAFHTGIPLLLITADRPPSFRGSGAPQSCDQLHIFGGYTSYFQDVTQAGECDLRRWNRRAPAHINVCLEEPQTQPQFNGEILIPSYYPVHPISYDLEEASEELNTFLSDVSNLFIIVSTLPEEARESTINFLLTLSAPVMLEGVSGLREEPRLASLRVHMTESILASAEANGYPIDGVLRIGGVPTHRIWRDLESKMDDIQVLNITQTPFSGLSWNRNIIVAPIDHFLSCHKALSNTPYESGQWLRSDNEMSQATIELYSEEPNAEASFIHAISKQIAPGSRIYLGNSLPIREWDLAAINSWRNTTVMANRGLNGIDGQLSTFLGLCRPGVDNWAFLGDLTTLYDLVGPWIVPQLEAMAINIVIINNGGGKIFEKVFNVKEMLNSHSLNFESFAKMWGINYKHINDSKDLGDLSPNGITLIEVAPDHKATRRFWAKQQQPLHAGQEVR